MKKVLLVKTQLEKKKPGGSTLQKLFSRKPGNRQLYIFCTQLAAFYKAGISFTVTFEKMAQQTPQQNLKEAILNIKQLLDNEGMTLADAMERQQIFPPFAIHAVRAGEFSGTLHRVLIEVAGSIKQDGEIQRRIKSTLLPIKVVAAILTIAVAVIFFIVVPKFQKLYSEMNVELPFFSRAVFGVIGALINYWFIFAAVAAGLWIAFLVAKKRYPELFDALIFSVPIYNTIYNYSLQYRLATILQLMKDAGIDTTACLKHLAQVVNNAVVRRALINAASQVDRDGYGLAEALQANNRGKIFDYILLNFLSTGEESGTTSQLLRDAAQFYSEALAAEVEDFSSKITPFFLIPATIVILAIMISIYMPMFTILQAAK